MGFLATREVEVCSASELVAQYVGQTGPQTQKMFQKALGKVLFIDEAYRLASGPFGKEAVDEIVNLVTLPKYKSKLVVVLAGYDRDINHLLASNPGFGSRFSEVIEFPNLSPQHCQELLVRLLEDKKLGVSSLRAPSAVTKVQALFQTLSGLPGWGNARDVESLATSLFGKVISALVSPPCLDVAAKRVYATMNEMIKERRQRAEDASAFQTAAARQLGDALTQSWHAKPDRPPPYKIVEKAAILKKAALPPVTPEGADPEGDQLGHECGEREPGVSDEAWRKLEERKAKSKHRLKTVKKSELKKEEEVQQRLIASGRCVMGFEWLRVEGGFQCAGGSHYMSLDDIWKAYGIAL